RRERNHGLGAAIRAHRLVHLLRAGRDPCPARRRWPLRLAILAAVPAPGGGMRETVLPVELLLTDGEQEILTAIHALDGLVFERSHDSDVNLPLGLGKRKSPAETCRAAQLGEWIGARASPVLRMLAKLTGTMVQPEIDDAAVAGNYRKAIGRGQRNV